MTSIRSLRPLIGAGLLLAPVLAHAAAFSFGEDWSISANPHNGYSYGHAADTTGPLTLYDQGFESQTNIEQWRTLGVQLPLVVKNTGVSDIVNSTVVFPPASSRYLLLHPAESGRLSVVSYVLPQSGTLTFTADFNSLDTVGGATTDVHVLLGGTELFSGNINGIGSTLSYTTPGGGLAVTAGNVLEVRVGFGANGDYLYDSTGVKVEGSITAVPEPAAAAVAGLALVAFGALRRCRR